MFLRQLYSTFKLTSAAGYWMNRRFSKAGIFVLIALSLTAAVGVDTNRAMTFQAFTFLLALIILSIGFSFSFKGKFKVARILPSFCTVGEPLTYRIEIQNLTSKKQVGLLLIEGLNDPRPTYEEFEKLLTRTGTKTFWAKIKLSYARWHALITKSANAWIPEKEIPSLASNQTGEIQMDLTPLYRGRLNFDSLTIARSDPLGFFRAFVTLPLKQSMLVLPKRYQLPPLSLLGKKQYQRGGVALASSVGESEEFVSLRDYRPGDAPRHIHWKSWAKTGKPIIKEYQDEYFTRHALILDTFLQHDSNLVFEEAVSVAASFACNLQSPESLLDLMFVGPKAYCFTSGRGLAHAEQMLEILASVQICYDQKFDALEHLIMERIGLLSGCVCVLLSWDEERKKIIDLLETFRIPTMILLIQDTQDQKPDFPPSDLHQFHVVQAGKIEEGLAQL